jgi:hypothetical protein
MSRALLITFILGIGLVFASSAAFAHHAISAEFDVNQPIEFTGKVVKIDWLNPHTYTHVEVEQEDGTSIVYKVEGGPPNSLYRNGWRKDTLPIGATVNVSGIRARLPESTNVGSATILNEAGQRMFSGRNEN